MIAILIGNYSCFDIRVEFYNQNLLIFKDNLAGVNNINA